MSYFDALRRFAEEEERKKRAALSALGNLFNPQSRSFQTILTTPVVQKRKVFISYYHGDEVEVTAFVKKWAEQEKVFIAKGLGFKKYDDSINSDNPEYVMGEIRQKLLEDTSVTIVLIGKCTHSRRYVDWEIKTSLRQGEYTPNGLIGILLPSQGTSAHLPPRFSENWNSEVKNCYARYHSSPTSASQLRGWIDDAYNAKTARAKHIQNSSEMMKNNAKCKICGVTH